jgi:hypothetical protein
MVNSKAAKQQNSKSDGVGWERPLAPRPIGRFGILRPHRGGAMGILIFAAVLLVMGFVLAWIIGVVANEEVDLKPAMWIVFLNGILVLLAGVLISMLELPAPGHFAFVMCVSLASLAGLLNAIAKIPFKKGLIIAVVFALLTTGTQWGLRSCTERSAQNYTPPPR